MKKNFKRLFALVLTLCLLASLMVPVAFAEDEAVAAPSATVAETYPIRLKDLDHTDPTTAEGLDLLMVHNSNYKAPSIDADKLVEAYTDGTLNWMYVGAETVPTYRADVMWQLRLAKGWTAFQIRVEDAGLYALNVATDRTYDDETEVTPWSSVNKSTGLATNGWAGNVSAYIIPLSVYEQAIVDGTTSVEGTDGTVTEVVPTAADVIPSLMADEYGVGTVALASADASATFAKTRMEGDEYVVVLDASGASLPLAGLSLLGDAYVMENVATYDLVPYDLSITDAAAAVGTVNEELITATTTETTDDTTGEVTTTTTYAWNADGYVAGNVSGPASRYETAGWKYLSFGPTASNNCRIRFGYACQIVCKLADSFLALQINVPESDNMYLSLTSDRCTTYASPYGNAKYNWTGDVTAYLIPISVLENTKADGISAAMTEAYLLGTETLHSFEDTVTFDKTYVEAGEYALVYSGSAAYYGVCEASLDKVAGNELPESEQVTGTVATYNFELYDTEEYANFFKAGVNEETGEITWGNRGLSNSSYGSYEGYYEVDEQLQTVLNRNYANGQLNWTVKALDNVGFLVRGANKDGVRIQKAKADVADSGWIAFSVNVPTGGIYTANIVSEYASNYATNVYVLSADADIAASLTEENKVTGISGQNGLGFSTAFSAGENLIVFQICENAAKSTIYLSSITLSVVEEPASYSMDLMNNDAFDAALSELSGGIVTAATTGNMRYRTYTNAEGTETRLYYYDAMAAAFASGSMDWFLDTIQVASTATTTTYGNYLINGSAESSNIRIKLEGTDETDFAAIRIRVKNPGTYAIDIAATCTKVDGMSAYIVPAPSNLTAMSNRITTEFGNAAAVEANLAATGTNAGPISGTYTFEAAGEYIIILKHNNNEDGSIYLSSINMTPVSANYAADGKGYATFEDAVANATESIMLMANAQVGELVVPAGVTLDLNGYILYATSVDATAPGAQVIDATDGNGLIRGDIDFAEDNAQLPLYDIDNNTYKLFNVEVESCATTGSGSATKYWFKVNFSNAAALDMIGQFTELRVQADMTGVIKADSGDYVAGDEWAAVAYADAAFSNSWAANSNSYIVVSAVGSNLSSFKLNPGITANGVVISGDAMTKN